jgi:hypothetical protein
MFKIDVITVIDLTITVGIVEQHIVFLGFFDIITIPRSNTDFRVEWTFTIDMTKFWTVHISVVVFSLDGTSVDFTSIKSSVVVGITIVDEDS